MFNKFLHNLLFIITVTILSTAVAISSVQPVNQHSTVRLEETLSFEFLRVLNEPDSVSISFCDHYTTFLSDKQVSELQASLLSDNTYEFDVVKESIFIPSSIITFGKNCETVEITISKHAEQVRFFHNGRAVVIDCDPGFEAILSFLDVVEKERSQTCEQ